MAEFDHGIVPFLAAAEQNVLRELIQLSLERQDLISLAGGLPADELFDAEALEAAAAQVFRSNSRAALQYNATEGFGPLRESLAGLTQARGIDVAADHLIVTSGAQQGIDIVTRCLVNPGDVVLVERPTFITALQTFRTAQADIVDVASDAEGPVIETVRAAIAASRAAGKRVKFFYLVPTFSNPAGRVISLERRYTLLALAVREGVTILEDDPYSELWFDAPPPPSIRALADGDAAAAAHVLYLSSLSKLVSPGLRVGWAVLPPVLVPHVRLMKSTADIHSSVLSQAVAEAYLGTGRLQQRMANLRRTYMTKGRALAASLTRHCGEALRSSAPVGGMFLWAALPERMPALALSRHALTHHGVAVVPGDPFFAQIPETNWIRLSFSQGGPDEFDQGARRLASALKEFPAIRSA